MHTLRFALRLPAFALFIACSLGGAIVSSANAATAAIPMTAEAAALAKFQTLPFYHKQWLAQDTDGINLHGVHTPIDGTDLRSEILYPPFILSPRRQTDSMVRQLYSLLPASITSSTAFISADRFAQRPEDYLAYLKSRKHLVISGSFMGIGHIRSHAQYDNAWGEHEHIRELAQLEACLALAKALNKTVLKISYAMGDSNGEFGSMIRAQLQIKLNALLAKYGYSDLQAKISWGADETMAMAMASLSPDMKIKINYENPDAVQWYDGKNSAKSITEEKLSSLGLSLTTDNDFDLEVAIFTRRDGGSSNDYQSGDTQQETLDETFANHYRNYTPAQRAKLVIVDGRLFNGAWDTRSLISKDTDYLAFGAWGTFGNKLGLTLASAKISFKNPAARQQLFLEAVAHDVFFGGYEQAQRAKIYQNLHTILLGKWSNWSGWKTIAETELAFNSMNQYVNTRMQNFYGNAISGKTFRFTPQFWRLFEAEVHMTPPLLVLPVGVFRKDSEWLDPRQNIFPSLSLPELYTDK